MKLLISCLLGLMAIALPAGFSAEPRKLWSVSAEQIKLGKGEKIVGFTLNLKAAWVYSLLKTPEEAKTWVGNAISEVSNWYTTIECTPSAKNLLLEPGFFKDFVLIEKEDGNFESQLVLVVSAEKSNRKRRLVLKSNEITLKPYNTDSSTLWHGEE